MNRRSAITFFAALPAALFITGCLEIMVRTTVSSDGSSHRIVSLKLDKHELPYAAYPIPRDSSWTVKWNEFTEGKQTRYEYRAEKKFATAEQLEREYSSLPDTGALTVRVHLRKNFQWFYTYFDYDESYTLHNPFNAVPVSSALTSEEIDRYLYHQYSETGIDSVLNEKVEAWSKRNEAETLYQGFVSAAERRHDPALPVQLFRTNKERFFTLVELNSKQAEKNKETDIAAFFLRTLEEALSTKAVYGMKEEVARVVADYEARSGRITNNSYENSIQLPGLLVETNSEKVEGNAVTWKVKDEQLKVGEFHMRAQSCITNLWAFVIFAVVGLALLVIVAARIIRKSVE